MNEARTLARIALAILGLYILITTFYPTVSMLPFLLSQTHPSCLALILGVLITILIVIVIIRFLIIKSDSLAAYIARPAESATAAQVDWPLFAFRLAFVIAGIHLFWYSIIQFWSFLYYIFTYTLPHTHEHIVFSEMWFHLISAVLELIGAIYLLAGAPRFTAWHLKQLRGTHQTMP
jgi:hypothetical protein